MKLTFLGATHEVTGSCTMIEAGGVYGLVDCGMEQGKDTFENQKLPVSAASVDFVLLTHAHIDHSGLLPLLCKNGFRGKIYASRETCSLCNIMLRDCANIQMQEAEWKSRKSARAGKEPAVPLYDLGEAVSAIRCLRPCVLGERLRISECVEVRFVNAGHLLGSASVEVWLTEKGVTRKVVFSGDLGNKNLPILREKDTVEEADYVVVESTYGDRLHDSPGDCARYLADCIQRTFDRGGNVVIPAFAVGRTQEMLYLIRQIKEAGMVSGHDGFRVYVDSPLAIEATGIFLQCDTDCLDEETRELLRRGVNPLMFPGLCIAVTSEESKRINDDREPKIILSASGMCEAGRNRHHLKHNLWRENSTILFVGYQAAGTLGRKLLDGGVDTVKLFGDEVAVRAEIAFMPGKSGHADQAGLLEWLEAFRKKPRRVFVNHGEDAVTDFFAGLVHSRLGLQTSAPYSGAEFDLAAGRFVYEPEGVPVQKHGQSPAAARKDAVYEKLTAAGQRLLAVIRKCRGMSNKELARFTDQINNLCDRWQ